MTNASEDPRTAEPREDRPVAVVDIDGVLADVRHRLHHLEGRPKRWDAFFRGAADDPPLAEGFAVVSRLAEDHEVVLLSGRPEWLRATTARWLQDHGLQADRMVLRGGADRRPARLFKAEAVRRLARGRRIGVVVDDDVAVCRALEAEGWPVLVADWVPRPEVLDQAQERDGRT